MTRTEYRRRFAAIRSRRDVAHWLWYLRGSERAALELWQVAADYERRAAALARRFHGWTV